MNKTLKVRLDMRILLVKKEKAGHYELGKRAIADYELDNGRLSPEEYDEAIKYLTEGLQI